MYSKQSVIISDYEDWTQLCWAVILSAFFLSIWSHLLSFLILIFYQNNIILKSKYFISLITENQHPLSYPAPHLSPTP